MRSGVPGSAHLKSSSPISRIRSFKQRNAQTSNSTSLPIMTLPTVLPKLIAFDLVSNLPFRPSILRLINFFFDPRSLAVSSVLSNNLH